MQVLTSKTQTLIGKICSAGLKRCHWCVPLFLLASHGLVSCVSKHPKISNFETCSNPPQTGREHDERGSNSAGLDRPIREHHSHQPGQPEKRDDATVSAAGDGGLLGHHLWAHRDGFWNESRLFTGRG